MHVNQANASGGGSSCPSCGPLPHPRVILRLTSSFRARGCTRTSQALSYSPWPTQPQDKPGVLSQRCRALPWSLACTPRQAMLSLKWDTAWARRGERMLSSGLQGRGVEESRGHRKAYSLHLGISETKQAGLELQVDETPRRGPGQVVALPGRGIKAKINE